MRLYYLVLVAVILWPSLVRSQDTKVEFDSEAIMAHVHQLASKELLGRRAGTPFERRSVDYISQQLTAREVNPLPTGERTQAFRLDDKENSSSHNVFGCILPAGVSELNEVVVLGAHLDHVGETNDGGFHPGADDNASGVAVVLEVARQLKRHANLLKRPVVIVFFGAEEIGLVGSHRFVLAGPIDNARIAAMVNIDMIGRPLMDQVALSSLKRLMKFDSEKGIGVVGTKGRPFFAKLVDRLSKRLGVSAYGSQAFLSPIIKQLASNRSDHAAFERVGIPTLFLSSGISDDYHQPSDTVDKLIPSAMALRAKLVYELVVELASVPIEQLPKRENAVAPNGESVQSLELRNGDLTVTLKDNSESPKILSGLQSLTHSQRPDFDAFDPDTQGASAGLNFEHIISGHRNRSNSFSPRNGKYALYRLPDGKSATLLRKREDSPWDVSSELTYTLQEPHYIDFDFRCTPHNSARFGKRKHAIFFFANYMNDVMDPAIHFRGIKSPGEEESWISANAPAGHPDWNQGGTYRHVDANPVEYDSKQKFRLNSWSYDSPRYTQPFYYGRAANDMVMILMFDRDHNATDEIRFSQFKFKLPKHPRPAWDFQYVIHRLIENKHYGFRGRMVWKPWVGPDDCLAEYERWHKSLQ